MFPTIIKPHKLNLSHIIKGMREINYRCNTTTTKCVSLASFFKNSPVQIHSSAMKNNDVSKCYEIISAKFSTNQRSEVYSDKFNSYPIIENGDEESKKEKEILSQDTELHSLLADIMKDFDVGSSTDPPGCKEMNASIKESSVQDSDTTIMTKSEKGPADNEGTASKMSVFTLEELVNFLRDEKLKDISVIKVPGHLAYCDYLVLATAFSIRHLKASTEFLCKTYKAKKSSRHAHLTIEGKGCKDWKVIDMNSIVLHLFTSNLRQHYDIETLWTVGEKFDDLSNVKQDNVEQLLQQHTYYFDDVKTAVNGQ